MMALLQIIHMGRNNSSSPSNYGAFDFIPGPSYWYDIDIVNGFGESPLTTALRYHPSLNPTTQQQLHHHQSRNRNSSGESDRSSSVGSSSNGSVGGEDHIDTSCDMIKALLIANADPGK